MYTGFMADMWLGMLLLVGGAVGTVCTVRRARGPRERNVLLWACIAAWIAAVSFIAGVMIIPRPFGVLLWLPYAVCVPLGVSLSRRACRHAREKDGTDKDNE
jgi:peptidoglycan/LPS O-acetylase OafA/YrhL